MKQFLSFATLLLATSLAAPTLTSCNKKEPSQQIKSNGLPKATANANNANNNGVAVVDIDSLAERAEYCKEGRKALEAKQNAYRQQLNAKGQALQNAVANFQKKVQSGAFSSQQEAQQAQAQLQKQQQALESFQERIGNEMNKATEDYQAKLRKDIAAFLKDYNSDGRFKVIISKSGDNVLYSDPSVDITNDVIDGLNKSYKKSK